MSHEIEADFVYNFDNENAQCQKCSSYSPLTNDTGYCHEAKAEVPKDAHCDFFQSVD